MNTTNLELPEITAKKYAELNGLAVQTVNDMCYLQHLPARKMNAKDGEVDRDDRGLWWVNLLRIKEQIV